MNEEISPCTKLKKKRIVSRTFVSNFVKKKSHLQETKKKSEMCQNSKAPELWAKDRATNRLYVVSIVVILFYRGNIKKKVKQVVTKNLRASGNLDL